MIHIIVLSVKPTRKEVPNAPPAPNLLRAAITYHPECQRTFGNTMTVWGLDILLNTVCNLAKKFWPDLRRKIHLHRHPD
jgi:hypothetical protein